MLNPSAFANAAPAGVAVLEVAGGSTETSALPFVPLQRTTVNGRWHGPLADITVTHIYSYTRAQCDRVLEAIYRFPLPGDAAVRRVVLTFGEVEIVAELKERGQAEADYAEAKRQGRQAALTTRESPDVFTLRVAGLQPDQDVVVETTYAQLADAEGVGWSLRIPLTTAPRYTRSDERGNRASQGQPLATYRDPGHRFSLDMLTGNEGTITSTTHALRATEEDDHTRVQLATGEMVPDRDCVLHWQPIQGWDRPALHVVLGDDPGKGHAYFAALVAPPSSADTTRAPAREAIVLVDHSGSMDGLKREAADRAALRFVSDLSAGDRFNLGMFHDTCAWLGPDPVPAGPDALPRAERFLAKGDGGGTNLGVALEQALTQKRLPGEISRQVVVITDAQVTDETRILGMVENEARRADRRRVSVLCIDAAPNSYLTLQLAREGGGIARFLTSAPDDRDMGEALQATIAGWSQPVAVGLRLEVSREGLEVSESVQQPGPAGWSAVDLGDLTTGRSLWVVGRVPTGGSADLTFRLAGAAAAEAHPVQGPQHSPGALKAVFGAYRVHGLERLVDADMPEGELAQELKRLGYGPAHLPGADAGGRSVYPENARRTTRSALSALLLSEALDYGLLCSVTGFVAVRREQGRKVEETAEVGNALPAGWSEGFAVPRSAPRRAACIAPPRGKDAGMVSFLMPGAVGSDATISDVVNRYGRPLRTLPETGNWPIRLRRACETARARLEGVQAALAPLAEYEESLRNLWDLGIPELVHRLLQQRNALADKLQDPSRRGEDWLRALERDLSPWGIKALGEPLWHPDLQDDLTQRLAQAVQAVAPAVKRMTERTESAVGGSQETEPVRRAAEDVLRALASAEHLCRQPRLEARRVLTEVQRALYSLQDIPSLLDAAERDAAGATGDAAPGVK